jgi:hypothetical protein
LTTIGHDTVIEPPKGYTQVTIEDVYPDSSRTLIGYQDIGKNAFHETHENKKEEYLLFMKDHGYGKQVLEKIRSLLSGIYYTYIKAVDHVA